MTPEAQALALLESHLTPIQRLTLKEADFFYVVGGDDRLYALCRNLAGDYYNHPKLQGRVVIGLTPEGNPINKYEIWPSPCLCPYPCDAAPPEGDALLANKLLLETNVHLFYTTACSSSNITPAPKAVRDKRYLEAFRKSLPLPPLRRTRSFLRA